MNKKHNILNEQNSTKEIKIYRKRLLQLIEPFIKNTSNNSTTAAPISTTFSKTSSLIELCNKLKANLEKDLLGNKELLSKLKTNKNSIARNSPNSTIIKKEKHSSFDNVEEFLELENINSQKTIPNNSSNVKKSQKSLNRKTLPHQRRPTLKSKAGSPKIKQEKDITNTDEDMDNLNKQKNTKRSSSKKSSNNINYSSISNKNKKPLFNTKNETVNATYDINPLFKSPIEIKPVFVARTERKDSLSQLKEPGASLKKMCESISTDFTKANTNPAQHNSGGHNQIPLQSFFSFVDGFIRPLEENDLPILLPEDESTYYTVPEHITPQDKNTNGGSLDYLESEFEQESSFLHTKLTRRILSCLLPEKDDDEEGTSMFDIKEEANEEEEAMYLKNGYNDKYDGNFGKRLCSQLEFLGFTYEELSEISFPEEKISNYQNNTQTQDGVRDLLYKTQIQLYEQVRTNNKRKLLVLEKAKKRMAYQEYTSMLEEVDKQIEQGFLKRIQKATKSKKMKKENNNSLQNNPASSGAEQDAPGSNQTFPESLKKLIEKRNMLIDTFSPLFKRHRTESSVNSTDDEMLDLPKIDVFEP